MLRGADAVAARAGYIADGLLRGWRAIGAHRAYAGRLPGVWRCVVDALRIQRCTTDQRCYRLRAMRADDWQLSNRHGESSSVLLFASYHPVIFSLTQSSAEAFSG